MSNKRKESTDSNDSVKDSRSYSIDSRSYSIDSRSYSIDSIDSGESKINCERKTNDKTIKFFEKIKSSKRRNRDSNDYVSHSPQLSDILKLMEHFNNTHEKIYHK